MCDKHTNDTHTHIYIYRIYTLCLSFLIFFRKSVGELFCQRVQLPFKCDFRLGISQIFDWQFAFESHKAKIVCTTRCGSCTLCRCVAVLAATDWQAFKKRDRVQVVLVHPHNAAVVAVAPLHALIIATVVAAAASLGVPVVATVAAAAAADSITWR